VCRSVFIDVEFTERWNLDVSLLRELFAEIMQRRGFPECPALERDLASLHRNLKGALRPVDRFVPTHHCQCIYCVIPLIVAMPLDSLILDYPGYYTNPDRPVEGRARALGPKMHTHDQDGPSLPVNQPSP
jgi:hypothetical protein